MRLEELYAQKFVITRTNARIVITGKYSLPKLGHKNFEHRSGKNPRYIVIVNGTEESTTWVVP